MIRIPGAGRIENRIVDGAANPYLSCAALLAAGLGWDREQNDPGPINAENLHEASEAELKKRNIRFLPSTLREALDKFSKDPLLQEELGIEYSHYYLLVKGEEWRAYHQTVSAWETGKLSETLLSASNLWRKCGALAKMVIGTCKNRQKKHRLPHGRGSVTLSKQGTLIPNRERKRPVILIFSQRISTAGC